ncbi:IclR family transcriptional regulator [Pseudomonas fluorescens]|uniref:IclR family transcriptional regulator n=1 Tax=Pseudomonas fluorescens TaxID=294 RepID=UPI0007321816|nr:IclR family transcriptional regulator [Pseudomonas fluorescens]
MASSESIPGTLALTKGIQVLRAISEGGRNARFADLMAQTGFPKPTLYRIIKALMVEGLVRHDPKSGSYHLGVGFLRLAFQVLEQLDIREVAHEELKRLSHHTSEAVHLAVLDGRDTVYIDIAESSQAIGAVGKLGSTSATYAAASGKVIVAFLPNDALRRLVDGLELSPLTAHTVTSKNKLLEELAAIRERGYALNEEEETPGIHGVAAPIFNLSGEVIASIGISIPSFRYDAARLQFYVDGAVSAARDISAKLGNMAAKT